MVAVFFLDALTRDISPSSLQQNVGVGVLAETYVQSALADWERVLDCERQFGAMTFATPAEQSRVNRSLYEVYQKWAADAEQILLRTRQIIVAGGRIENVDSLEHAFGRVQARLKMTPEMFDRAREQIRQDQGIPMEGLRNGIRARVRA
jgi:hypothetical protein